MQNTICHKRIGIQYIVRDGTARMLDTNLGGKLLYVEQGAGNLLPAIEACLLTMNIGQWKRILLGPDQLFGEYDIQKCMQVKYTDISNTRFSIGDWVMVRGGKVGMVLHFLRDVVVVDFNHPLAGRQLDIEIGVMEVLEENNYKH